MIDLGLMFLRGYTVYFDNEKTGFATASKDLCYAKEDSLGIGSVEWAPVIKVPSKKSHTVWLIAVILVLVVVVIACVGVIIRLK